MNAPTRDLRGRLHGRLGGPVELPYRTQAICSIAGAGLRVARANPVSVTMDGDKSVTANFKATTVLIAPTGTLTSWDNTFSWTGLSEATWYLLEVYTSGGTQVLRKWYTSAQTGCSGGTACSVSHLRRLAWRMADYKWRILDYGAYGYGTFTPYLEFTLNQ